MANYKDIHGALIETVTTDPSDPVNGQVWYNSDTQTLKGFTSNPAGTWSTSGAMNNGRGDVGSAGTQTAALGMGGYSSPFRAFTEDWNGISWAELGDLNTARQPAGEAGTSTSALAFGGDLPPDGSPKSNSTEEWNGSSVSTKTMDTD